MDIPIPSGYEIDTIDNKAGKIILKQTAPKSLLERVTTVEALLTENNWSVESFEDSCEGDEKAYRLIKMLVSTLNEGWLPDWSNYKESKYYPYFEMKGSSGFRVHDCDYWNAYSRVGSRLCFKSSELAEHAGTLFIDVYRTYMVI